MLVFKHYLLQMWFWTKWFVIVWEVSKYFSLLWILFSGRTEILTKLVPHNRDYRTEEFFLKRCPISEVSKDLNVANFFQPHQNKKYFQFQFCESYYVYYVFLYICYILQILYTPIHMLYYIFFFLLFFIILLGLSLKYLEFRKWVLIF